VTFLEYSTLVTLNSAPVVAGIGPPALVFWLAGFLLFFLLPAVLIFRRNSGRNKVLVPGQPEAIQE
jgi:energy-converting hydrogenase Eha subunit G